MCSPPRPPSIGRIEATWTMEWNKRALIVCGVLAAILWPGVTLADDPVERAFSLIAQEQYAEARKVLDPLLKREPNRPRVRLMHGILLVREGNAAEAIAVFESLRSDQPDMFEPYNNLAVLYAEQGRFDAARETLIATLERRPDAVAYANLGDVYMRLADRAYERAREIGSGGSASLERGEKGDTLSESPVQPAQSSTAAKAKAEPQAPVAEPGELESAAMSEPTSATASGAVCVQAGKFRDRASAVKAAKWMQSRGLKVVDLHDEKHRVVKNYWVFLPAFSSHKAAVAKLREIRGRGIRDVAIIGKGAAAKKISLGVYKNRSNMRRRMAELKKLGYPVMSAANMKIRIEYVIKAHAGGARPAFDRVWTSRFPGHPIRYAACTDPS